MYAIKILTINLTMREYKSKIDVNLWNDDKDGRQPQVIYRL